MQPQPAQPAQPGSSPARAHFGRGGPEPPPLAAFGVGRRGGSWSPAFLPAAHPLGLLLTTDRVAEQLEESGGQQKATQLGAGPVQWQSGHGIPVVPAETCFAFF